MQEKEELEVQRRGGQPKKLHYKPKRVISRIQWGLKKTRNNLKMTTEKNLKCCQKGFEVIERNIPKTMMMFMISSYSFIKLVLYFLDVSSDISLSINLYNNKSVEDLFIAMCAFIFLQVSIGTIGISVYVYGETRKLENKFLANSMLFICILCSPILTVPLDICMALYRPFQNCLRDNFVVYMVQYLLRYCWIGHATHC